MTLPWASVVGVWTRLELGVWTRLELLLDPTLDALDALDSSYSSPLAFLLSALCVCERERERDARRGRRCVDVGGGAAGGMS